MHATFETIFKVSQIMVVGIIIIITIYTENTPFDIFIIV